ncbi:hypothetical protein [Endozoicomonas sp. ISHI1]|uniref:hypothetical protein n=1 Tax=Endozoicomonas sp. ISHI1 TaxID=2825882 RepID=UPI00214747BF|nr:hypothetical protein [Endozoicomonas sp. ISHI1]
MNKETLKSNVITQATVNVPKMLEVAEFKQIRYPGKRPCLNTLKKWIREGILQGEIRGGMYFVDLSAELMSTGDDLLNEMLGL